MSLVAVQFKCTCGADVEVVVPEAGFEKWQSGIAIQVVLSDVSVDDREKLITRLCQKCLDEVYGSLEEDETESETEIFGRIDAMIDWRPGD